MTAAHLIYIDREGEVEVVATGDLESFLTEDSPPLREIVQADEIWSANIEAAIEDLSRVGARYHEFIGGTIVLALLD